MLSNLQAVITEKALQSSIIGSSDTQRASRDATAYARFGRKSANGG
jgi:hypothetical protein